MWAKSKVHSLHFLSLTGHGRRRSHEPEGRRAVGAPFEWQDCGDLTHAITRSAVRPPLPGDQVRALCGSTLTLTREDFSRENRFWISTCKGCMDAWVGYQAARAAR